MKHGIIILLLLTGTTAFDATAQSSHAQQCLKSVQPLPFRPYTESESEPQPLTAQQKQRQFLLKVEKFITSWSSLAHEYNEKGTFNVKKARETSKAFHDLEKSEGWPRETK